MTSTWLFIGIVVATLLHLFIYRMRSKKVRARIAEPPEFARLTLPGVTDATHIQVSRPIRVLLGITIACGGAILAGALLAIVYSDDLSTKEHLAAALLVMGCTVLLGLSFVYVGLRLVMLKTPNDRLIGTRAARVGASIVAFLALAALLIGIMDGEVMLGLQSLPLLAVAYGLVLYTRLRG